MVPQPRTPFFGPGVIPRTSPFHRDEPEIRHQKLLGLEQDDHGHYQIRRETPLLTDNAGVADSTTETLDQGNVVDAVLTVDDFAAHGAM